MISRQEKEEMSKDAKSILRRKNFRLTQGYRQFPTLDGYLAFLNSLQKIFGQFSVSHQPSITVKNKL